MTTPTPVLKGCAGCASPLDFDFSMAFQPIVDVTARTIFAHEALVRGLGGEGAGAVLGQVTEENRFAFDQRCRVKAVDLASRLEMPTYLSINFLPNAVYEPTHCLRTTIEAAERNGFPLTRIIFEVTEGERVTDHKHLKHILTTYKASGLKTAIDDFGAGYAGLNLLADFQPDIIKLDMDLTRGIDRDRVRRAIVRATLAVCRELDITAVAEGVETEDEMQALQDLGISLMQGYLFAKPGFEALPAVNWPLPKAAAA